MGAQEVIRHSIKVVVGVWSGKYRATCACGWAGGWRDLAQNAGNEGMEHTKEQGTP